MEKTMASKASSTAAVVCPAVVGEQNGMRVFTGVMSASDLIAITTVDYYNSSLPPDHPAQGYQRQPERTRITKIGSHLIHAIANVDVDSGGIFPTAVILAAREPLIYKDGLLRIAGIQLQVIDGQHRIGGIRYALSEKDAVELNDFPIPFVIVEISDRVVEMNQFRMINGTAKSVRTDLVNSILTATAAKRGDESVASKDRWKVVVTQVVDGLDKRSDSPWRGLILMPDEAGSPKSKNGKIVRATSFMTSLRPVYARLLNMGSLEKCASLADETEVLYHVVSPFWEALGEVVPAAFAEPENHVIQKTPGLFSLHKLLQHLVPIMFQGRQPFSKEAFVRFLGESPEIADAHFWHKDGNRASNYGSMKGFEDLYDLLKDSIAPKP